jgi:hypothetical protein
MAPSHVRLVDVSFTPNALLADSQYILLGENDQVLYLRPCRPSSADTRVLMIPRSEVRVATFAEQDQSPRQATLPNLISGQPLLLGLSAICGQ